MSALSIQPTYPIFTETDGQPLEDGYIWIGTANLDPEGNPIAVYWDAALTQLAGQPIRTQGGYPVNSGTPARLYVNSDYSIRVMNKNGSVVYSAPAATERYSDVVVSGVNAEDVVYDPPFTGGVATNVEAKLAQTVSVKDFGAVGDGVTDDTAAIQAAIDAAAGKTLYINDGIYIVSPLTAVSNSTIVFDPAATLQAKAGYGANDRLLNIYAVSNVTIHGNHANIVMNKAEYTTGEQRHGVIIRTSSNVTINDLHVSDTGGDGFYIGSTDSASASTNISLNNCFSDNARRNGLSIVSGDGVYINGGEYSNTNGTSPEFGIDIEANGSGESLKNINIIGVRTANNALGGIQIVLGDYGLTTKNDVSINIDNCYSYMDGAYGGIRFANAPTYKLSGSVNITNQTIENPYAYGMQFIRLNNLMPFINIDNLTVINPAFSNPSPGNIDLSCIDLNAQTASNSGTVENVSFNNIKCIDNRASPVMFACIYAGGTYGVNNVSIRNLTPNTVSPGRSIIYAGNCTNINAVTDVPFTTTFSTAVPNVERYSVGQVLSSSSGSTMTLSAASTCYGVNVTFAPAVTTLIAPAAGDTIFFQGLAVSTGVYLENGDSFTLKAVTGGWQVVRSNFPLKTGSGSPVGSVTTRFAGRQYFDTSGKNFWVSTGTTTADWKLTT